MLSTLFSSVWERNEAYCQVSKRTHSNPIWSTQFLTCAIQAIASSATIRKTRHIACRVWQLRQPRSCFMRTFSLTKLLSTKTNYPRLCHSLTLSVCEGCMHWLGEVRDFSCCVACMWFLCLISSWGFLLHHQRIIVMILELFLETQHQVFTRVTTKSTPLRSSREWASHALWLELEKLSDSSKSYWTRTQMAFLTPLNKALAKRRPKICKKTLKMHWEMISIRNSEMMRRKRSRSCRCRRKVFRLETR